MAWTGDRGYLQSGNELWELELSTGRTTAVARLPEAATTLGHFTVSGSGSVVNAMQLQSKIYALVVIDPASGSVEIPLRTDVRLGHSQVSPTDENLIFHVHETGGDALQRMWMYDRRDGVRRPFFVEQDGDWITHETWHPSGEYLTFIKWPYAIMKGWADGQRFEVIAEGEYHHAAPDRSGGLIAADRTRTGEILLVDAATGRETVLVTGHSATVGPDHCHPSFNRAGDKIVFSAPGGGVCRIGVVDV
jgi:oligogalacturonide lyase